MQIAVPIMVELAAVDAFGNACMVDNGIIVLQGSLLEFVDATVRVETIITKHVLHCTITITNCPPTCNGTTLVLYSKSNPKLRLTMPCPEIRAGEAHCINIIPPWSTTTTAITNYSFITSPITCQICDQSQNMLNMQEYANLLSISIEPNMLGTQNKLVTKCHKQHMEVYVEGLLQVTPGTYKIHANMRQLHTTIPITIADSGHPCSIECHHFLSTVIAGQMPAMSIFVCDASGRHVQVPTSCVQFELATTTDNAHTLYAAQATTTVLFAPHFDALLLPTRTGNYTISATVDLSYLPYYAVLQTRHLVLRKSFEIVAGEAEKLVIVQQEPKSILYISQLVDTNLFASLQVCICDAFDNVVTMSQNDAIILRLEDEQDNMTLCGKTFAFSCNGRAEFTNISIATITTIAAAQTYKVLVSCDSDEYQSLIPAEIEFVHDPSLASASALKAKRLEMQIKAETSKLQQLQQNYTMQDTKIQEMQQHVKQTSATLQCELQQCQTLCTQFAQQYQHCHATHIIAPYVNHNGGDNEEFVGLLGNVVFASEYKYIKPLSIALQNYLNAPVFTTWAAQLQACSMAHCSAVDQKQFYMFNFEAVSSVTPKFAKIDAPGCIGYLIDLFQYHDNCNTYVGLKNIIYSLLKIAVLFDTMPNAIQYRQYCIAKKHPVGTIYTLDGERIEQSGAQSVGKIVEQQWPCQLGTIPLHAHDKYKSMVKQCTVLEHELERVFQLESQIKLAQNELLKQQAELLIGMEQQGKKRKAEHPPDGEPRAKRNKI